MDSIINDNINNDNINNDNINNDNINNLDKMDKIDFTTLLNRNKIADDIKNILSNFKIKNKNSIYISGDNGCGKTTFIKQILKSLNYDIIYYDNTHIRNKNFIEKISSNNLSKNNVLSIFNNNPKKIIIVFDDIDNMNCGDKNGLISLTKIIREKKTKRQKQELYTNIPVICINNNSQDKKILELMKTSYNFKLKSPSSDDMLNILNILTPKIFKYDENTNNIIKKNILLFVNNNLYNLKKIIFYYKNDFIYKKFYITNTNVIYHNNIDIKTITKTLLTKKEDYLFSSNNILETDRTIISLLFHENILQLNINLKCYIDILNNFVYCDYIDRVIFQKQIWQLNDINYLIKIFYNNYILNIYNSFNIDIKNIIFTKILTKYSSEYNNYIFIYNLLQNLLIDKKDLLYLFIFTLSQYSIENIENSPLYNFISKLEFLRFHKFIIKLLNYNKLYTSRINKSKKNINNINIDNIDNIDNNIVNDFNNIIENENIFIDNAI